MWSDMIRMKLLIPVDNYIVLNQNNINPASGLAVIAAAFQTSIGWAVGILYGICRVRRQEIR
jgi:hypothetical protein